MTMKSTAIALALAAGLSLPVSADVIRLSEPVQVDERYEVFGAPFEGDEPPVALGDLVKAAPDLVGSTVTVETRVAKVCQKKGCFFIAQDGAHAMRVSFKDYGFFVPTDIGDRVVTLVAEVIEKTRTADEAAHLTEDAGSESAALQPGRVFELVASSVRVPRSS